MNLNKVVFIDISILTIVFSNHLNAVIIDMKSLIVHLMDYK
jgi:hypothetical protein